MSIELKNVSKEFGDVAAVNNVNFSVKEGELMVLLGPSGGGKTTVLRMIAGLELPTEGDIFINRVRVNDIPVQKRNIGFVLRRYPDHSLLKFCDEVKAALVIGDENLVVH